MKNAYRAGERIYLRPLEVEDVDLFQRWVNEPEIHCTLNRIRPVNRVQEREWLEGLHKREAEVVFGIALRENDQLIGCLGLHELTLPNRAAVLGIMIGERERHGCGYGAEAIGLLLAYGFGALGLHRVGLEVFANNERGIRCYEKCGFRKEGVRREARWWDGRWWDVLAYGILESEWRERIPSEAARAT